VFVLLVRLCFCLLSHCTEVFGPVGLALCQRFDSHHQSVYCFPFFRPTRAFWTTSGQPGIFLFCFFFCRIFSSSCRHCSHIQTGPLFIHLCSCFPCMQNYTSTLGLSADAAPTTGPWTAASSSLSHDYRYLFLFWFFSSSCCCFGFINIHRGWICCFIFLVRILFLSLQFSSLCFFFCFDREQFSQTQ
jgi:hypothetical protein